MIGYIAYRDDVKTWHVEERNLLGLRFLTAAIPRGRRILGKYCAARAARCLGRLGVRQAVFPSDFPWGALFARQGILPVDILPLCRRMMPVVVKRRLAEMGISPGRTTVAAVGENLTGEIGMILTELALQVRYLTVSMKYGAEEFCHSLRREYGVSALQRPTREQLAAADVLLLFSPRADLPGANPIVIRLYHGAEDLERLGASFALPPRLAGTVEENCRTDQLLCALLTAGILQNYQIPVREVDKGEKSYYNADTMTNIE